MGKYNKLLLILILVLAPSAIAGQETVYPYCAKTPEYSSLSFRFSDIYKNKAREYLYEGNFDMMKACIDIQEMLNASGNPVLNGDIENQKGVIEYYRNNSNSALGYYLKALDYYSMAGYNGGINSIMNNIAIIFDHIEDYESTRKYLIKAIEATPEDDINSRSIYLLNLAETESELGNCSAGIRIASDLLKEYNPEKIHFSDLSVYGILIACYNNMGMKTEAREWINRGIDSIDINSTYFDKLAFYSEVIKYYFDIRDYSKVIELGLEIYPPADTSFMRDMYEPINYMAIAALESGDLDLAIELDDMANRIMNSSRTLEREDLITPLMVEYSFNRDIAKRDLAELQLSENHKTEKAHRYLLISLVVIMIVMLVNIPVVARIRRLRKKFRSELAEKNKSIEQLNRKLDLDNKELEKGNKLLDTFISVFAHDLINPFQAIIGFSQLMTTDHDALKKEDFIEYSELLSDTSFQLNQLLTNLRSLSITHDDPRKLKADKVVVKDITDKVIKLFESLARKKNIEFRTLYSDKECTGYINGEILESAIRNIVSNALKFSEANNRIELSCSKGKKEVKISVRDYGVGIPPDILEQIYHRKHAQSKAGTANEKGSGIGLAISMELLETFKGSLELKSKIGEGTEAIIKIPAWNE